MERKASWPSVTELIIIVNTQELSTTTPDFSSSFTHNKPHTSASPAGLVLGVLTAVRAESIPAR